MFKSSEYLSLGTQKCWEIPKGLKNFPMWAWTDHPPQRSFQIPFKASQQPSDTGRAGITFHCTDGQRDVGERTGNV